MLHRPLLSFTRHLDADYEPGISAPRPASCYGRSSQLRCAVGCLGLRHGRLEAAGRGHFLAKHSFAPVRWPKSLQDAYASKDAVMQWSIWEDHGTQGFRV
ncbi:unnamed protein product [Symbiodinium necroappetens]|uniref:Uncharacterized protein n=1 Tax=Symbiodinium necroappetens TaxID=1628268 RepID=A0A812LTZ6_9DINO|nr:unnamed protein product [Symbiodinium necroappetens]